MVSVFVFETRLTTMSCTCRHRSVDLRARCFGNIVSKRLKHETAALKHGNLVLMHYQTASYIIVFVLFTKIIKCIHVLWIKLHNITIFNLCKCLAKFTNWYVMQAVTAKCHQKCVYSEHILHDAMSNVCANTDSCRQSLPFPCTNQW